MHNFPTRPQFLAASQAAMAALLREGESANTRASYQAAARYWAAWYGLRYRRAFALPLPADVAVQFILDHAEHRTEAGLLKSELPGGVDQALVAGGYKGRLGTPALATLLHRLAVLSALHETHRMANPCRDPVVRQLVARTKKAYAKRGHRPQKKDALTREPMEAMLATCDGSLRGMRDRALLLFAWASGGRRRSEVSQATVQGLRRMGPHAYIYTLAESKSNHTGEARPEDQKPIVGAAAEALDAWLSASGIKSGALFRRIRRGGRVAEPLSAAAVRKIVKARCAIAGLEGDFSAHSLRSGFLTEAGRQNVHLAEAMAMSGHTSMRTALGYFRSGALIATRAATLIDVRMPSEGE